MRILMLSGGYPLPADNGSKRRILASANQLSQRHDVTLVSLREHNPSAVLRTETCEVPWQVRVVDLPVKNRWQTALRSCFSTQSYGQVKYWCQSLQLITATLLATQRFDCIWVHVLHMAPYVQQCFSEDRSWQNPPRPLFVLDQHNVFESYYRSFLATKTNPAWRAYAALEVMKARRLQRQWFPRFDAILCVASEDLHTTAQYVDAHTSLWLVPNGVDIDYFQPVVPQEPGEPTHSLVFGASMDAAPNQDAARWFATSILPSIRQQVPDVQFWIVGRDPPAAVRCLAEWQGIRVTGTVSDVRDYYRRAAVFVVPLRVGGGTKLKTLEAMAMGLPVVCTAMGAQGLDVESGRHLCVADDPDMFSSQVIELLRDREKAARLGAEARWLVEQKYSWGSIMGEVDHKLTNLLESHRGRS